MPMTKEEAIAEASKREKHKSRTLYHKVWAAQHNSVKGWHVALVDNHQYQAEVARVRARKAAQQGDLGGFMEAASDAMMAGVRAALSRLLEDDQSSSSD